MKAISYIAHLSSGPGPERAAAAWSMARRLQNISENCPRAGRLLPLAAATPRPGTATHPHIV